MNNTVFSIFLFILGLIIGFVVVFIVNFLKKKSDNKKADSIIETAKKDADKIKRESLFETKEEIHKLKNIRIDVAFVPLDPRQEEQYYWGLDYFMKHTDTELVFPMHMWGHYEVYEKLMNNPQAESYKEHVMHVKVPGQVFELP